MLIRQTHEMGLERYLSTNPSLVEMRFEDMYDYTLTTSMIV